MGEESPKQRAFSFTLSLELEKLAAPKKKEIEELEYLQSFKIYYLLIFLFIYTLLLLLSEVRSTFAEADMDMAI